MALFGTRSRWEMIPNMQSSFCTSPQASMLSYVLSQGKDEAGKPINDWWKPSLALLNEKDFLNRLKSYDKDNIPPRIVTTIRNTYLTDATFTPENAKRASPAAEGMCKWVHAMSSYDKVAKVVAPKKAKLAEAEAQYQEVMVGLTAKQAELQVRAGSVHLCFLFC